MDRIIGLTKHLRPANLIVAAAVIVMAAQALFYYGATRSIRALSFSCLLTLLVISTYALYKVLKSIGKHPDKVAFCLFVVMMSLLGVCYLYAFPPSTVPDEIYHNWAAYQLSNRLMLIGDGDNGSLIMRSSDALFFCNYLYDSTLSPDHFNDLGGFFEWFNSDPELVDSLLVYDASLANNPIQDRLLPAIGITIGRLLGLGSVITYYLGRIFNLAGFIVMAAFSVRITPVFKKGFMVIAMLPMTMHLAASYSYDVFIIGMSLLLTALCFRAIWSHGQLSAKMLVGIAVIVILLAPCKVIYTILIALIYFIPNSRFASKRQAVLFKVLLPMGALAVILAFKLTALTSMIGIDAGGAGVESLDKRGLEEGHLWSLTEWLSRPGTAFMMVMRTLLENGDFYAMSAIGGNLAWFQPNIVSSGIVFVPMLFVLVATALRSKDDDAQLSNRKRAIFLCIVVAGFALVMLSMLTGWTFDDEIIISGVQGRYLLPFFPLLVFALRPKSIACDLRLDFWLPYSMFVISAINLARIMGRCYMG